MEIWELMNENREPLGREVAQVEWMTKAQVRQLYDAGKLVPTLGYFFHRDEF